MSHLKVGLNLNRMREGMAVVQESSHSPFTFISCNNLGLNLDTSSNSLSKSQLIEILSRNKVILGHLAESASHLTRRQRIKRIKITNDTVRLPISANKILTLRNIDTCFPTDSSIDHGKQRCSNMHDWDAAMVRRCSKPCDVGHHATTNTNYNVMTSKASLSKGTAQR